jgi:carbonic anhydrase
MLSFKDEALRKHLEEKMGARPDELVHFHAFDDLEENVRVQVERIKSHPWVPRHIPVRGFVYDVKTGRLREVTSGAVQKVG